MIEELKNLIKGDVATDEATLAKYSRDASLFEVRPKVVVFPKDSEDIQRLVRFVAGRKDKDVNLSLTARAGGSDMTGGPLNESIILDFTKYINRLKEVGQDYAVVEPGMWYRDFEKETLKKNLLMPSFPASKEICAVGGMVANNAGGEKTLAYGKTEDYVRGLNVVLADGNEYVFGPLDREELEEKIKLDSFEGRIYKQTFDLIEENYDLLKVAKPNVSKNSAGYYLWNVWDRKKQIFDLTKLFVGSQGTLGIITKINLGLISPKPRAKLLVIFLPDLKLLAKIIERVLQHKPETFESYDDHTLKLAMRFFFQFVKLLKSNLFSLAWQFLPEVAMVLTGGFPKLVLTAEFTGETLEEVVRKARAAQASVKEFGVKTRVTRTELEAQKYRTIRRESFSLLRHQIKGKQTAPFIDDIIVRTEKLPEFLPRLEKLLEAYQGFIYTIAGHVGNGNFHIIPLMNLDDPKTKEIIKELTPKVYNLVLEYDGSITAEHNDGLIRSPFLKDMYGEKVYKLFEETKRIFDPKNIFNPGKKVNASFDYTLDHIKSPTPGVGDY